MNDNPTTTGMDGADRPEWHDPQHEVDGYMVVAVAVLVSVLLGATATAMVLPPPLHWWQITALLSAVAVVSFGSGMVVMAACAMAGYSDMEVEHE